MWAVGKPLIGWFQVEKKFVGRKVKNRLEEIKIKEGNWLGSYFSRDERCYESQRSKENMVCGSCAQNSGGLIAISTINLILFQQQRHCVRQSLTTDPWFCIHTYLKFVTRDCFCFIF